MKPAIIAITKDGSALAVRLGKAYGKRAAVYLPEKFIKPGMKGVKALGEDLAARTGRLFADHDALVFIMAAGIVVRLIAPHIKDKRTDPAVVVMDEAGEHAVSLLSGHAGGANRLATEIAGLIGARPVITTASDVQGIMAVDIMAEALGCVLEDWTAAKKVTAALVNGDDVSLYCQPGPETLSGLMERLPGNIRLFSRIEDIPWSRGAASIVITPYIVDEIGDWPGAVAVLRPRTLVAGIGCNRGTGERQIAWLYDRTLKRHGLSALSVRNIATITDKNDEQGLISFANRRGLKIDFISRKRLKAAETPSGPSDAVYRNMGVYGVCEPAAMVSAGSNRLLVQKRKTKDVTMAVAEVGV